MTETNTGTTQNGAESHAEPLSGEGQAVVPDGPQKGNKEARYRVERNQAREELTTAQARIEAMNRREVERLAGEHLAMPGDLFSLSGNELADYLTEDGEVDPEKVAADVAVIVAERPGLRKPSPYSDPSQGRGGAAPKASTPTFADLFKP